MLPTHTHNFLTHNPYGTGRALGSRCRGCLCGRCWRHRPSLRVAGVALLHCLCWRAWFPLAPRLFVCVRRGVWKRRGGLCGGRHRPPFCVASMAFGDIDLHSVWQAWCIFHWAGSSGAPGFRWGRVCLCGSRGVWKHRRPFGVAGVVLGDIDLQFVRQAWHLCTGLPLVACLVPVGAVAVCVAGVAFESINVDSVWQALAQTQKSRC